MPPVSSTAALHFHDQEGCLSQAGRRFDAWRLRWTDEGAPTSSGTPVTPVEGLRLIAARPGFRRVPVGIIGPKNARPEHREAAEELGRRLTQAGLQLLTGGRGGVMEAASKGAYEAGGMPIGLTPDDEWDTANDYVAIPLASGLGPARNAVIGRACEVLVAIGGEYGTLSEMAFGMHFSRLVLAFLDAPEVAGVPRCASLDEVMERTAKRLLRLDA